MADYKNYKLGKLPAKIDYRTILLKNILKVIPPYPSSFNVDSQYPNLNDNRMFKNDVLGDCVIAGRAHHTLRFENFEQKEIIKIADEDVVMEYLKETGGVDSGLDIMTSLNEWRKGWAACGKWYSIYAYAKVDVKNKNEIMAACYMFNGLSAGLLLPISAQDQIIWDVADNNNGGTPGSWGGHASYIVEYDDTYLTCVTWGTRQKMTWAFFQKYCDQAFAVIDNIDEWLENSPLDVSKLSSTLTEITGTPVPDPTPKPPIPDPSSNCNIVKILEAIISFFKNVFTNKK